MLALHWNICHRPNTRNIHDIDLPSHVTINDIDLPSHVTYDLEKELAKKLSDWKYHSFVVIGCCMVIVEIVSKGGGDDCVG